MSADILTRIIASKRAQIERDRSDPKFARMPDLALAMRANAKAHRLREALTARPGIIAEFKRASPSAGVIRGEVEPGKIAQAYERGGARAISVLTDEEFFGGSLADLVAVRAQTAVPILRKDFVVDASQIFTAAMAGADAVLLIVAALDDELLQQLRITAEEELGLDALVEVHTAEELQRAVKTGATLIGVNNRNLHTFQVSIETSERLIADAPPDAIMISESGLSKVSEIERLRELGYRGFLLGEMLMRAADAAAKLSELAQACDAAKRPS